MSSPVRALIVDDEPLARERLRTLLAADPGVEVVGECANGLEAIRAIEEHSPDLLFLDVQMPELDGFGVLQALGDRPLPAVIFVTAYDKYALQAFEVQALDYLLKPFDRERFERALQRAKRQLARERSPEVERRLAALLRDWRPASYLERLVVRSSGRVYFVKADEVEWIEAQGNYVLLHAGRDSHLLRETMAHLEARLDPRRFLRIHRSYIVNLEYVQEMLPLAQGEYVVKLRSGAELPAGRGYRDKLRHFIKHHGG